MSFLWTLSQCHCDRWPVYLRDVDFCQRALFTWGIRNDSEAFTAGGAMCDSESDPLATGRHWFKLAYYRPNGTH